MIATSGALMMGVLAMPPSLPRLVTVMVEPLSSSRVALLLRAASLTRRISAASSHSAARLRIVHHRHLQAIGRLRGDAQVHRAVTHDHAALRVVVRIALRKVPQHAHQRERQERQVGERRGAPRASLPFRCRRSDSSSVTSSSST